jgi:anti-sigma regulatory factor (Ser/Thr protein kinase)
MARQSFECSEESVGAARRFVADQISDVALALQDAVLVMVSELSTNALVHAAAAFVVTVNRTDHELFVCVSDQGEGRPELRAPDASQPHGRGMRIVDALSDEWGVSSDADTGKSVWFRLAVGAVLTAASPEGRTTEPVDETLWVREAGTSSTHGSVPVTRVREPDSGKPTNHYRGARHSKGRTRSCPLVSIRRRAPERLTR